MKKIVFVILAHSDKNSLSHLINNVKFYCDKSDLVLYNSGDNKALGDGLGVTLFPNPRRLYYGRITEYFFDVFEWLHKSKINYDYFINLETDMLFIQKGFEEFIEEQMREVDYLGPGYRRFTPEYSLWPPFLTLRPELHKWYNLFRFKYTHRAFCPGQVFSKKYIEVLLTHPKYSDILHLIELNESFTLPEVLFPTLPDLLKITPLSYPKELESFNRYRPYFRLKDFKRALLVKDVYFIHPVRREPENKVRLSIKAKQELEESDKS